jgi:hypothetical protein
MTGLTDVAEIAIGADPARRAVKAVLAGGAKVDSAGDARRAARKENVAAHDLPELEARGLAKAAARDPNGPAARAAGIVLIFAAEDRVNAGKRQRRCRNWRSVCGRMTRASNRWRGRSR